MDKIRKHARRNEGFTLVEIAIVVAIIGLLLLIALPLFTGARVRAYIAEARSLTSEWKAVAWSCLIERNFRESRCDSLAENGWFAPGDSDVWDWAPTPGGAFLACGDGVAAVPAPSALVACVSLADTANANAWIAVVVPPFAGFLPNNERYVLLIRTNTGRVQESPADGSLIP